MASFRLETVNRDDAAPGKGAASSAVPLRRWLIAAAMAASPWAAYLAPAAVAAESRMVVANETIVRRTCPSVECGGIGRFNVGESVVTYETQAGWTRVSPYYTAGCHDGQAAFVQFGPAYCTRQNGIEQGEFAEWVKAEFLKVGQPAEIAAPSDDCSIGACVKPGILRADD